MGADGGIDNPLLADIDNNDSNENIKENIKGKVTFNESAATVAEENSVRHFLVLHFRTCNILHVFPQYLIGIKIKEISLGFVCWAQIFF